MKIYTVLQIGEYHTNYCEDYLFVADIGSDKVLCAVMDGCTMATDSYFAATLVGKLLRKICLKKGYDELYGFEKSTDLDTCLKSVLRDLFEELRIIKNQLLLTEKELLTTLIILLFDKKKKEGIVMAIGDGLISINGVITEYDQDNKPDYLGFHLHEDFNTWYAQQKQTISFNKLEDISIATDGIFSISRVRALGTENTVNAFQLLLQDNTYSEDEDMLYRKLKLLEHQYGLKPTDDIAVIRVIM